jgi:hypothetical protein
MASEPSRTFSVMMLGCAMAPESRWSRVSEDGSALDGSFDIPRFQNASHAAGLASCCPGKAAELLHLSEGWMDKVFSL